MNAGGESLMPNPIGILGGIRKALGHLAARRIDSLAARTEVKIEFWSMVLRKVWLQDMRSTGKVDADV